MLNKPQTFRGNKKKLADQRELAVLEAQKAERDITGKAFDVVEGNRQDLAKEKRAEKRKKEEMEAEQKFKREISKMEIQARVDIADKSPSSQVEYIGKLLDSDDAKKTRAR
jgi:hypothetical protein